MSCESCRFAHPDPDGSSVFECRRRPPVLLSVGNHVMQKWPLVDARDWCGEEELPLPPDMSGRRA